MIKRILFAVSFYCIFITTTSAVPENLRFKHIDINAGLSNSSVNSFYQDHLGFIWIGTENGLNKYDGAGFLVFRHERNTSSINNNKINCVYEDSRHYILVGTNQGLSVLDRTINTFRNLVLNAPVNVVFEDSKGNIWFGTDHGELHLFDLKTFKSTIHLNNESNVHLSSNAINALTEDNNGNLYISRAGTGLNKFDINTRKFTAYYKRSNGLSDNFIQSIYFDKPSGVLWVGTSMGLDRFDPRKETFKNYNYKDGDFSLRQINSIVTGKDGNLWLGSESNGVFVFNPSKETFKSIHSNPLNINSLSTDQVRHLYKDKEGNMWVGCYRGGINLLTNNRAFSAFQYIPGEKNTLNNKIVLSVLEDRNNNLWIGTDGGGLNYYDRKTGGFTYYKHGGGNTISDNTVQSLFEDKEGKIWIGTLSGGLSILNPKTKSFSYFKDPDSVAFRGSNDVRAITGDQSGNIWIATNGNGISKFGLDGKRVANYRTDWQMRDRTVVTNWIRSLYVDKNNNVWVGSVSGISIFDQHKFDFKNIYKDGDEDVTVYSICEDSKGIIWVGTPLGLKKYDRTANTFETYTIADGLPDNIINGIIEDKNNNLWLSTNNGLAFFNQKTSQILSYDVADGLPDNSFIVNGYAKGYGGRMYFGSSNGLLSFHPDSIKRSNYIAPITLTGFRVFNKPVQIGDMDSLLSKDISITKEIKLSYDHSVFAFEFAAPNFANPKKNQYRYMLKGFDKEWIYNGSVNTATYTSIAPGTYTFIVSNAIENGVWNEEPASIVVIVKPPFWRTGFAYLLYLIIIGTVLYYSRKSIINREKLKNDLKLEKVRVEKAEEINNMKLNFFTNVSHEFKTPLTLIIGPVERLLKEQNSEEQKSYYYQLIHRNSQRLLRLINEVLDLNKIDSARLKLTKEKLDIVQFIQAVGNSFNYIAEQKKIQFRIASEKEQILFLFDAEKLEKVIVNLLSNAFKFTREYGKIEIRIDTENYNEENFVVIKVKDNGDGIEPKDLPHIFERFYKSGNETANAEGTGIGLAFVKELVELHSGRIEVQSKVGDGAEFTVFIPMTGEVIDVEAELSELPEEEITSVERGEEQPVAEVKDAKLKILLIEDNEDVRTFLKTELTGEYIIEEASNGRTGLERAYHTLPDLIISDVMMPEMDGTEVCKQLKTDIRTSHIPVILLTAKSSQENQLKGFETGADAYVTKPYNFNVLQLQIRNILSYREKLRKKVTMDTMIDAKEITVTNADEKLMQKAIKIIEDNLSDTEFNVNKFASEIGISRTLFYAKIKNITGQTVNDFIQTIRLKHAANLLVKTDQTISEIGYSVGFNTPKYFSKCFKDAYGMHPTQYRETNKG